MNAGAVSVLLVGVAAIAVAAYRLATLHDDERAARRRRLAKRAQLEAQRTRSGGRVA